MSEYHLKMIVSYKGGPRIEDVLESGNSYDKLGSSFEVYSALFGDGKSRYDDVTPTVKEWAHSTWPENWEELLYATRRPRTVVGVAAGSIGGDGSLLSDVNNNNSSGSSSLTIYSAYYGIGPHVGECVDVTKQLRSLVKDSSLDIIINNSTLTPNQNLFRGKKKHLTVVYSIDKGEDVVRTIEEKDWLIIGPAVRDGVNSLAQQDSEKYELPKQEVSSDEKFCPYCGRLLQLTPDKCFPIHAETAHAELREVDPVACKGSGNKYINNPSYKQVDSKGGAYVPTEIVPMANPPLTPAALNDYLIRKFSISPQRLRGPMPIEVPQFHRNDLAQLFTELGFKRGAEIGVAEGNYSEILLKANPECELLLVDPWHAYSGNPQNKSNERHEFAYNEVVRKTKNYPHVDIRQGYSMDVVDGIMLNELDFVYVDACHLFDDCVMDIIEWSKRVRSGGIISGDDYYELDQKRWTGGGVVEAVQAYTKAHRIPIWWLFAGHKSVDFMWVKP